MAKPTLILKGAQAQTRRAPSGGEPSYPASFFTGPLGANNIVPSDPNGALIGMWTGVAYDPLGEQGQRNHLLQRLSDSGRSSFDFIQFQDSGYTVGSQSGEDWAWSLGSIPVHTWNAGAPAGVVNGSVDGTIDAEINRFKNKPYRVMIRLMHEFNERAPSPLGWASDPALFVQAWRYIVDRFRAQGATNCGFYWCPGERMGLSERTPINNCYPGDQYVDWVGSDRYNAADSTSVWSSPLHSGWSEFDEIFNYNYYGVSMNTPSMYTMYSPIKPFVIAETGSRMSNTVTTRKRDWFRNIDLVAKNHMPNLCGIIFFDQNTYTFEYQNWMVDNTQTNAMFVACTTVGDPHYHDMNYVNASADPVTYQGWKDLVGTQRWKVGVL